MKRYRTFTVIGLMAALLLSACSQDELVENTALPEGEYPLQIGSVTLTAEVSEQPWTRVAESTDGMSSEFKAGDAIGVSLNGETATYTYDGTAWTSEAPLYWKDKNYATVSAWYPVDETIDFTHQDEGLAYLLKADGVQAGFDKPANLTFTHQLAKVRVKLEGAKANEVTAVTVRSYEGTNNEQGTPNGRIGTDVYVPMLKADYGDEIYWEANLLKGYLDADNTFRVSSDGKNFVQAKLTTDVDITPGHVHTIKIDVGAAQQVTGDINGNGTYIVSGTRTEPVTITGGNPTIYLENADINITNDNHAINIQNGNPTIYILGTNKISVNENNFGAGIYVAEGSSVTITGTSVDDILEVTGGNASSGIGGYTSSDFKCHSCGDITIENITVKATSNPPTITGGCAAAIGACGDKTVGSIKINKAVVTAIGSGKNAGYVAAAIGGGMYSSTPVQTDFEITISGSKIYVTKGGSYASYIGVGGSMTRPAGYDVISTAKITNSTIYNESGAVITK